MGTPRTGPNALKGVRMTFTDGEAADLLHVLLTPRDLTPEVQLRLLQAVLRETKAHREGWKSPAGAAARSQRWKVRKREEAEQTR